MRAARPRGPARDGGGCGPEAGADRHSGRKPTLKAARPGGPASDGGAGRPGAQGRHNRHGGRKPFLSE